MKKKITIIKQTAILLCLSVLMASCSSILGGGNTDRAEGAEDASLSEIDLNAAREARYSMGSTIPTAEGDNIFRDVNFAYNSSAIGDQARQNIEYNVELLKSNSDIRVQLEGHCDERGTVEYNLALGSERARSVKDILISYGITASRVDTISYGEELPLDNAGTEMAYSKNRRVHFSAYRNIAK